MSPQVPLLAVTQHAVQRVRERSGAVHLDDETVRRIVRRGVAAGRAEQHYAPGQERVLIDVMGSKVYVVVGRNKTHWQPSLAAKAVITALTPAQVFLKEDD